ncbi:MAG: hypothetical protein WCE79_10055 [Xanthobacteraceae bacterium]
MVEHYSIEWLVATLDILFGRISGVWFAAGFLPLVGLWAAWARRPIGYTKEEFWHDCETWNFGLPWTQAGLISTFVRGGELASELQVPAEQSALVKIAGGLAFDAQVRAAPAFFKLLFVALVFIAMLGLVTLQVSALHKLRESRPAWTTAKAAWARAEETNTIPTWAEWLARGGIGRIKWRRISWVASAWVIGVTTIVAAYMLNLI